MFAGAHTFVSEFTTTNGVPTPDHGYIFNEHIDGILGIRIGNEIRPIHRNKLQHIRIPMLFGKI